MKYVLVVTSEAQAQLKKVPANIRNRLRATIGALADDPFPSRHKPLRDYENFYRIPVQEWRVIYTVEEDIVTVTVVRVARKTGPEPYFDLES